MSDKMLLRITRSFRRGILGKNSSDMMCAVVCYPLHSLLHLMGEDLTCVEVLLKTKNHVFLRLSDGRILDPTADQFDGPPVYLGSPQWFHRAS